MYDKNVVKVHSEAMIKILGFHVAKFRQRGFEQFDPQKDKISFECFCLNYFNGTYLEPLMECKVLSKEEIKDINKNLEEYLLKELY